MLRPVLAFSLLSAVFSVAGLAKPVISTDMIVSAASYLPSGFPNSGIAQGSIFTVFGSDLGPSTIQEATSFPLQTTLAGTSIKITVGGTSTNAIMLFTLAGQVAALLPSSTPVGTGTLVLTFNGSASDAAPITVVKNSFAAFTLNEGGTGTAVTTLTLQGKTTVPTILVSAKPNDVLVLWGTGLGPITSDETQPAPGGNMTNLTVKMWVGGQPASIQYQGRSPGSAGLDQINFVVPAGVSGCFVPVAVQVDGVISTFPSIAVSADGGVCSDPAGLTSAMLTDAANGQNINLGTVVVTHFTVNFPTLGPLTNVSISEDAGSAFFYKYTPTQLIGSHGVTSLNSFGSCAVYTCRGGTCVPDENALNLTGLDAGSAINLKNPNGTMQLPKVSTGNYSASLGGGGVPGLSTTPPPYLLSPATPPQTYALTVSGPGGSAVGPFNFNINIVPTPITFQAQQNGVALSGTINLTEDLDITWTGGDSSGYAVIVGTSTTNAPLVTGSYACVQKNSVGKFTVPSWVLSAMPASGELTQSGITISNGFLLMGSYPTFTSFAPTGLDFGFNDALVLTGTNDAYLPPQ
jgi:uncharacterized protein (TIGR03437 family)